MAWFSGYETYSGFFLRFCYEILKAGSMPKHVAFIMDGNRRYAKQENIKTKDGHMKGFEKLTEVLHWCHELDIPEVTVYAFSIENFKRSAEEVDALISIFKEKIAKLLDEKETLSKNGVCIRFVGNIMMFDNDTRSLMSKVVKLTKDHKKSVLNIAVAYTSRDEITEAIKEIMCGVEQGMIRKTDINEDLLESCFYSNKSRPVDLLIRTSGEVRLSDFLLWQTSHSILCFVKPLWPEFSIWSFFTCILKYQIGYEDIKAGKTASKMKAHRLQYESDKREVLKELTDNFNHNCTEKYTDERQLRVARFIDHVQRKRDEEFFNIS